MIAHKHLRVGASRNIGGESKTEKSLKQTQFQDRLRLLGVTNSKARVKIRALIVSKTLALSDIILKPFHVSILRSPEWALSSFPTEPANSQTSAFKLFKKITGPFSGLVI